jgi:hypothetical protein
VGPMTARIMEGARPRSPPPAAVDALAPAANVEATAADGTRGPAAGWAAPASVSPSSSASWAGPNLGMGSTVKEPTGAP